jgi:hypothetical protein
MPRVNRADILRVCGHGEAAAHDIDAALALFERKGNLVMAERARRLAVESGSKLAGESGTAQSEEQRLLLE